MTSQTARSFAELGAMLGRPPAARGATERGGNYRERRDAAHREELAVKADLGPPIPCANCGRHLLYGQAVVREFSPGAVGFCHPVGECDPAQVGAHRAKTQGASSINEWQDRLRVAA